jgi:hypothetical protein
MTERIIITFNEDGTFRGAAARDHGGKSIPLDEQSLAGLSGLIETAALAEIDRLTAAHAEEIAALSGQSQSTGGISKLTLKRRLDVLGKWASFKAFLAALGEAAVDEFNLAAEIRADDPMFQQIAPLAKQALELTDEQYAALLTP